MTTLKDYLKGFGQAAGTPTPPETPAAPSATGGGMQPIGTPPTPTGFGTVTQPRQRVDEIAADMMKSDSPLMRQAETRGLQAANRRGLINSSIAVGEAQRAQLDAVLPMASAEVDVRERQTDRDWQERMTNIEIAARERLAKMDIDANSRRGAEGMISNILSLEQNTIANIMANTSLSAKERQSQIQAAESRLRSQMDLVEDLFGIDTGSYAAATRTAPTGGSGSSSGARDGGTWQQVGGVTSNGWVTERNTATGQTRRRQVA